MSSAGHEPPTGEVMSHVRMYAKRKRGEEPEASKERHSDTQTDTLSTGHRIRTHWKAMTRVQRQGNCSRLAGASEAGAFDLVSL